MVAVAGIVAIVHMAVEPTWTVEPWAGPDEDTTDEPVRAVVAVRCAVIRRKVEVAVRAYWFRTDVHADADLRDRRSAAEKKSCTGKEKIMVLRRFILPPGVAIEKTVLRIQETWFEASTEYHRNWRTVVTPGTKANCESAM